MPTVVVPFAGAGGKTRLDAPDPVRRELSLAMLGDVLAAASPIGATRVVTPDDRTARTLARELGAEVVADPGGGQGAAVQAALAGRRAGAGPRRQRRLPCVVPADLRALLAATPARARARRGARRDDERARASPAPDAFAPLYGPGSAAASERTLRARPRGRRPSRSRTSPTTSTRSTTSSGSSCALRPAHAGVPRRSSRGALA